MLGRLTLLADRQLIANSLCAWLAIFVSTCGGQETSVETVSYARDIRPILAANCFACHGPDEETREAGLRLDTFAGATALIDDHKAIVPSDLTKSELIKRVESHDEFEVMPPPETGKSLKPAQVELLKQWILEGANYAPHWAFQPPVAPAIPPTPEMVSEAWKLHPIDAFTLRKMSEQGLSPAERADRYTLIRRVSLDLIGLPPTLEEVQEFVNDDSPNAYESLVDRLLNSPHYGERWARNWLDLARYADTNGYEKDRSRSIWPYRDWVINALNADMPFDQFSIKQLAGDMLPNATIEDRIATGFHRNTMLNEEGGIDPLEYRFYAMVDRVATTGTTWLGMTIGCAQCHTHKYDPITHTDYYSVLALMNNTEEPDLKIPSAEITRQRQAIQQQIDQATAAAFKTFHESEENSVQYKKWFQEESSNAVEWTVVRPSEMTTNLPRLELLEDGSILSTGDVTKRDIFQISIPLNDITTPVTALKLEVLPDERLPAGGPGRAFYEGRKGDFFLSELTATIDGKKQVLNNPSHTFGKIAIGSGSADAKNVLDGDGSTGWSTATQEGEENHLVVNFAEPITTPATLTIELLFERHFAASLGRFRLSVASANHTAIASKVASEFPELIQKQDDELTDSEKKQLHTFYLMHHPSQKELRKPIAALQAKLPQFPETMVFTERHPENPRETHRYHRGEYLKPREVVSPRIPELFDELSKAEPKNRLELARWLVSTDNPLVGRVVVNRAWHAFFGRGFVKTLGDLGTQSELPTHPELLDWLALEFTNPERMNWSLKSLHRSIVLSQTYQQSSVMTDHSLASDPENRWLSRGPRIRLEAEMIRDSTLQASGLLSKKLGGPSVYPPQPAAVTELAYGGKKWTASAGEDRYRRSLYTFSKRTTPFAAYTVFDAPAGESCLPQRDRSNTPLQALTLLNDAMFLEAGRDLARSEYQQDRSPVEVVSMMFQRVLTRPPTQDEQNALMEFHQQQTQRCISNELSSEDILGEAGPPELAAWVMVARVLLNLDETVTKQ